MKKFNLNKDVCLSSLKNFKIDKSDDYIYPNIIDYRDFCLPTNDQGNTPHCVGYTVGGYLEVEYWKRYHIPKQFDADEIYKCGRTYHADSADGTKIEYCLFQLKKDKVIDCSIFSYVPESIDDVKYVIHQYGLVMCGLLITDEWYHLDRNYVIKENRKARPLGLHCVLCCGYSPNGVFIQNSWGFEDWGNYGFCTVPWNLWIKQIKCCVFLKRLRFNLEKTERFLNAAKC